MHVCHLVIPVLGVVRNGTRSKIPGAHWPARLANQLTSNSVRPCVNIKYIVRRHLMLTQGYCADMQEQTMHTQEGVAQNQSIYVQNLFQHQMSGMTKKTVLGT